MKAIDEDSGQTGAGIRLLSVHPEGHRESSDCSLTMTTLNVRLGCSLRVFAWNVRFECSLRIRMKLNKFKTNWIQSIRRAKCLHCKVISFQNKFSDPRLRLPERFSSRAQWEISRVNSMSSTRSAERRHSDRHGDYAKSAAELRPAERLLLRLENNLNRLLMFVYQSRESFQNHQNTLLKRWSVFFSWASFEWAFFRWAVAGRNLQLKLFSLKYWNLRARNRLFAWNQFHRLLYSRASWKSGGQWAAPKERHQNLMVR